MLSIKNPDNFERMKKAFEAANLDFNVIITSTTERLEWGAITVGNVDGLQFYELNFIKKVKHQILSFEDIPEPAILRGYTVMEEYKATYYNCRMIPGTEFENVIEVDLSRAYWSAAMVLGFITKEIHEEGLKRSKRCRLIALGSLSSMKDIYKHIGGGEYVKVNEEPIFSEKGKIFYSIIRNYVDTAMTEIFYRYTSIHFYWVDALFLPKRLKSAVCKAFNDRDFQYKIMDLKKITATQENRYIKINVDTGTKVKVFRLSLQRLIFFQNF